MSFDQFCFVCTRETSDRYYPKLLAKVVLPCPVERDLTRLNVYGTLVYRTVILTVLPGDCPVAFHISQLRFAKSTLRFGMGQPWKWTLLI